MLFSVLVDSEGEDWEERVDGWPLEVVWYDISIVFSLSSFSCNITRNLLFWLGTDSCFSVSPHNGNGQKVQTQTLALTLLTGL